MVDDTCDNPLMAKTKLTWHTVVNTSGQILAVYGAELLSLAQVHAAHIEHSTGLPVLVLGFKGRRPHIGGIHPRYPYRKTS